jgi:hypothetical protein
VTLRVDWTNHSHFFAFGSRSRKGIKPTPESSVENNRLIEEVADVSQSRA